MLASLAIKKCGSFFGLCPKNDEPPLLFFPRAKRAHLISFD
ncbi:MAG: hypothetical protein U5L45_09270 [Saprospiraceae bacterium]|nr:hypothetical protein [Saprospiraceae bacterium]